MEENLLWALFRNTGKIEYYLKYKAVRENNDGKRSNSWEEI